MENEKRLIDANAFFDTLKKMAELMRQGKIGEIDINLLIASTPTVDAVEVVRGQWIKEEQLDFEGRFLCSVCENTCHVPTCIGDPLYSYCPNCGAKMDGGNVDG